MASSAVNESHDDQAYMRISSVETHLWVLLGGAILLLGTVGNILVVLVIARRKVLRLSTNGMYLMCLALADLLVLYTGLLRHWILHLTDVNIRNTSDASCKVHLCLTYFATQLASWVLINLTMERVVAVFLPHRAKVIFTQPRAAVGLVITTVLVAVVNIPYLWVFRLVEHNDSHSINETTENLICDADPHLLQVSDALDWVHFAVASAVPFAIMAAANVAMAIEVFYKKRNQPGMILHRASGKFGNPTCLLLTVTTTFIVCTAPYSIYLSLINNQELIENAGSKEETARLFLLGTCLTLLGYTNNSINFILYCLMGTRFRRECVNLFTKRKVIPWVDSDGKTVVTAT